MTLWLPQDERRLLAGYFSQIGDTGAETVFREKHLCEWLYCRWQNHRIKEYQDEDEASPRGDFSALKRAIHKYQVDSTRIKKANKMLAERGLIKLCQDQPEMSVVVITLTIEGYDLGRRYASPLECSGLWFYEYKNHWIWLIVAFIGGAFVNKLIEFVAALCLKTPPAPL